MKTKYYVQIWTDFIDGYPYQESFGDDLNKAMQIFVAEALQRDHVRQENQFSFKHVLSRGKTVLMIDEYKYVPPLHTTTYV
jgi:hypothetical protein